MTEKQESKENGSGFGIAGLIFGILSILFFWFWILAIPFAILGAVFGFIQNTRGSKGLAIGSIVTSAIGLVLSMMVLIGMVALFSSFASDGAAIEPTYVETEPSQVPMEDSAASEPVAEPVPEPAPERVKRASVEIVRAYTSYANLQPVRIRINNTGDVTVRPRFDYYVYDESEEIVCEGESFFQQTSVSAGEVTTDTISSMGGCMFNEDGTYLLEVEMTDADFNILSADTDTFEVEYWNSFQT